MKMEKAYLASPYGFTDCGMSFMDRTIIPIMEQASFEVLNPWKYSEVISTKINEIRSTNDIIKQIELWRNLNKDIARNNESMIKASQIVVAILDGSDIDSGVSAEIGYAYALRKKIIGYRSDIRATGDNIGAKVNLQIEYFIYNSGGEIVTNIHDLKETLRSMVV
jgi:nucleoside 2-deoxyribosyltransferase